jgi:hypothetical protein
MLWHYFNWLTLFYSLDCNLESQFSSLLQDLKLSSKRIPSASYDFKVLSHGLLKLYELHLIFTQVFLSWPILFPFFLELQNLL